MEKELIELEAVRLKTNKTRKKIMLVSLIPIILGVILCIIEVTYGIGFLIIGGIILLCGLGYGTSLHKDFKEKIVKSVVKETLGENSIYLPGGGIPVDQVVGLGLVRRPDRSHTEDYISGYYNDVRFEMCDMRLEEKHVHSNGKTTTVSYETYFRGRVIKIDFKRDFNYYYKIVPNSFLNFSNLDKVETEVIEFNKKFDCFCSDKKQIFYYLTPNLINKIMELTKMRRGVAMYCMDGDAFYVLFNDNSDSLEFSFSKKIDMNLVEELKADINLGPAIINEFNLDSEKYNKDIKI